MAAKVAPDILGLGLGLTSWVFPDIHVVIKVGLTLLVVGIIVLLRMDKARQTTAARDGIKFVEDYAMPGTGGALRGVFLTLIGIMIVTVIFNIHLIDMDSNYMRSYATHSTLETFFHTLGNLTIAGNMILCIGAIIGAASRIEAVRKKTKVQV